MVKMSRYGRKLKMPEIDYNGEIQDFLKSGKVAFIPEDQRDTNRYHWHSAGEKLGLVTKTLKLWRRIGICGTHGLPIIRVDPTNLESESWYDSDCECDYDSDSDDEHGFCYRESCVTSKLRTVVIFNEEISEKIKNMKDQQIKDYLVEEGIIKRNEKSQYCI
jgi:hypothetical protein